MKELEEVKKSRDECRIELKQIQKEDDNINRENQTIKKDLEQA